MFPVCCLNHPWWARLLTTYWNVSIWLYQINFLLCIYIFVRLLPSRKVNVNVFGYFQVSCLFFNSSLMNPSNYNLLKRTVLYRIKESIFCKYKRLLHLFRRLSKPSYKDFAKKNCVLKARWKYFCEKYMTAS